MDGRANCSRNCWPCRRLTSSRRTIIRIRGGQPRSPNSSGRMRPWRKAKSPMSSANSDLFPPNRWTAAMQTIIDTGISGGLLWSLRFRDRDGGFYWHSEPSGGNLYKGFHWPGSTLGAAYDETNLMASVRHYAFAIRGLTPPPIPVPAPPRLLPITDAAAISWQGSVGAASYTVERAPKADGPWTVAGANIDESFVQYRPLFNDESAPEGNWFYRVRAKNEAGFQNPPTSPGRSRSHTQPWWMNSLTFQKSTPRRVKSESPRAIAAGRRKTRTAPPAMPVTRSSTSFRLRLKVFASSRFFPTLLRT